MRGFRLLYLRRKHVGLRKDLHHLYWLRLAAVDDLAPVQAELLPELRVPIEEVPAPTVTIVCHQESALKIVAMQAGQVEVTLVNLLRLCKDNADTIQGALFPDWHLAQKENYFFSVRIC